ncbi:MAG: ribosome recycling factor [Patescibacteria group bacterium]|nr:ribosome recycling factor [Patescibacteria group bacterium]
MKKEDFQNHLNKVREDLVSELNTLRTGRATAAIIEGILVEAYPGSAPLPLNEVGTVSIPDSQSILISPWDKSILGKIEDGIRKSGRGLNPVNEGDAIRIPVPTLTEATRKEKTKEVSKMVEDAKIKVRTVRHNAISSVEEQEDNKVLTEDELYREKESIDKLVKSMNEVLDELGAKKSQELMQI